MNSGSEPRRPIHEAAGIGFARAADAYERGRPDYPPSAVQAMTEALAISRGAKVVDVGCGTGKLTKLLFPTGARVLGIEPVEEMRQKLAELLPSIEVLDGTAESMPLERESADVVVAAQAFHWFSGAEALAEIHRVLKPGGRLGLVWNVRDESVEWVAKLTGIIDAYEKNAPRYRTGEWKRAFAGSNLFTPLRYQSFPHHQSGPIEMVIDRVVSTSFIAALPEAERAIVVERVRALLGRDPSLRSRPIITLPYRTDFFWCAKIG